MSNVALKNPETLASAHYAPGTVIVDKYLLETPLGEGGMGTVWLARNVTLDSPVALKLLRPELKAKETVERLLVEAQIEAKLRHPNIIQVFDFGETEFGDAFIVMERLEGLSLADFIEDRRCVSPIEAVQLLLPVIDALAFAHENGVVHRDLKPGNIFLDCVGHHLNPKVLDFGIAKLKDEQITHHRTLGGTLLGSPGYMAPEQARGAADVDHRADIWAVCVVLYEAISGTAAFPGEGYAVLRAVVEDELAPLDEICGGESLLWPILSRGMAKDRELRFQSMTELGTALARWLAAQGITEDLAGNKLSRSWGLHALDAVAELSIERVALAAASGTNDAFSRAKTEVREPQLADPSLPHRPRRHLELVEFEPDSESDVVTGSIAGLPRSGVLLRAALGIAVGMGVVLAPAKIGSDIYALVMPRAAVCQVSERAPLPAVAPSEPYGLPSLVSSSELPSGKSPPVETRPSPRKLSAAELGLKVPY